MQTELLATNTPALLAQAVEAAVQALAVGEAVALPTETVYGLAADALRPEAVVKIFEAKERPFFDPLIVHLPDRAWLERVCAIPEESRALVEALIAKFWPGPLTLVLPRREIVPDLVTSGLDTVAVRMPAHPVFRAVLARFGKPLAAPSANRFGRISPTAAAHVQSELAGRIPLILDGGATEHGLESTIVKVNGPRLTILRPGPIGPVEFLRMAADQKRQKYPDTDDWQNFGVSWGGKPSAEIQAPGQLKSHYAPRTPLILGGTRSRASHFLSARPFEKVSDAQECVPPRVGLLAFTASADEQFDAIEVLSATGDLREAAATLFAKLRRLDEAGLSLIVAESVPERGLGIAIMDRLRKAAAEHE